MFSIIKLSDNEITHGVGACNGVVLALEDKKGLRNNVDEAAAGAAMMLRGSWPPLIPPAKPYFGLIHVDGGHQ
ncbi:hypothetical protein KQX54_004799 [Cotesia glomerata]|uniref:Uncharacterized protein n=1 Tax=Cotesia glomerata TaxID=32391 RepID=A0AAV7HZ32_COTGL|nr:hypothetical protein KQX54_004799 [Cotesia glomerata]